MIPARNWTRSLSMAKIQRVFVEKKAGYDVEARALLPDLRENLAVKGLTGLRLLNRYDVAGISGREMARAPACRILRTAGRSASMTKRFPLGAGETAFASEYLPGQYDQRADSAVQCLQLLTPGSRPQVATARVMVLAGRLAAGDLERIKRYCINPVDSREAALAKPRTLSLPAVRPAAIPVLKGFIAMAGDGTAAPGRTSWAWPWTPTTCAFARLYFRDQERRDPTLTEIRLLDTYWSDHCRHTTFLTAITRVDIAAGAVERARAPGLSSATWKPATASRPRAARMSCLMDLALLAMRELREQGRLGDLEFSDGDQRLQRGGCRRCRRQEEEWLVMFKNETHNHPTEIEPFGGAATCLGGAIRDPLSGRAYVYQAMRVTGSGDPRQAVADTLPGKLPQRKITSEAAQGFSSYGNQIGLATGQVSEIYHPGYVAKRMEIGAVIGAVPAKNVRRREPRPGDVVLLVGGRTGRDGIGGATGSSKAHSESSLLACGAEVQKGNPAHRAEAAAAFPRPARQPADQALQRFRRRRRGRGHRRAGAGPRDRPGPRAQEIRRAGRHRARPLRIAGAHGRGGGGRADAAASSAWPRAENLEATVDRPGQRPAGGCA